MSEQKAEVGAGDVPITLAGKEYKLRCTLEAAQALARNNGLTGAVNRCLSYDPETIVNVIAQGLGKYAKTLPSIVYAEGYAKLSIPCIRYLTNLAHGGKPPPKEEDDGSLEKTRPLAPEGLKETETLES